MYYTELAQRQYGCTDQWSLRGKSPSSMIKRLTLRASKLSAHLGVFSRSRPLGSIQVLFSCSRMFTRDDLSQSSLLEAIARKGLTEGAFSETLRYSKC